MTWKKFIPTLCKWKKFIPTLYKWKKFIPTLRNGFCDGWHIRKKAIQILFLAAVLAAIATTISKLFKTQVVPIYSYLTGMSIAITFTIALSYSVGAARQGQLSRKACCGGAGIVASLILCPFLASWFCLFMIFEMGHVINLVFAVIVYALYMVVDVFAYKAATEDNQADSPCKRGEAGLSRDVRESFWQVDAPSFIAICLFTFVCLVLFPKMRSPAEVTITRNLFEVLMQQDPQDKVIIVAETNFKRLLGMLPEAFAQGGLAFLMLASSLCFALGFPKYVLFGYEPWFDSKRVCELSQSPNVGGIDEVSQ
jgi:hypothetical protein